MFESLEIAKSFLYNDHQLFDSPSLLSAHPIKFLTWVFM